MTKEDARLFALDHIERWNAHDLDKIMEHYSDDVVLTSPLASNVVGKSVIEGKPALRAYFARGLEKYPDLHFGLIDTLLCENTVTLYFKSVNDSRVAEVLFLNSAGQIEQVLAHYAI